MRLNARLAGLRAQRDALQQAISAGKPDDRSSVAPQDLLQLTRGDAIVAVLEAAAKPLHIREITDALASAGRRAQYDSVSVDLTSLVQAGRVRRVGRGLYAAP